MDITIVVVRTKRANLLSSTFDFRDEYDILLLKGHRLPKVTIAGDRNHSLLTFVNDLAGLKGVYDAISSRLKLQRSCAILIIH